MKETLRRWHYRTVHQGDTYMDFPLTTKEAEVRRMLSTGHRAGYWSNLRKGAKVEKDNK